jgi:UDP-glucose 4-epimerase
MVNLDYTYGVRVLITGGAGFIGSHLCDALVSEGEEVTILDNLSSGSKKNITHLEGKIKLVQGDIRDQKLVESLVAENNLILHMAASLGVNNILENPIESISTNFYGSELVLKSSAKYDKRLIIASTSEIYGKNPNQTLKETDDRIIGTPQKLRWSYSDAKALEEAVAYSLYLTNELKVTTVRFFNTVGPRQTGEYGMVIPRFVKAAIANKPLKVFGDGSQSRVFCHVLDTIRAILLLVKNEKSIGEVFNIGGRGEITILQLAELIINQTNSKSNITLTDYKDAYAVGFEDMARRVPDISKIKQFTGWEPEIDLKMIIKDVAEYAQRNLGHP